MINHYLQIEAVLAVLIDHQIDRRYETQIIVLHTYFIIETFMK